jgi:hypothetical protein
MQDFKERFFYHSFPRRGASTAEEIEKGKQILTAIRDFGFVLTPQFIEWTQPNIAGPPRTLPDALLNFFIRPTTRRMRWRWSIIGSANGVSAVAFASKVAMVSLILIYCEC